MADMLYPHKKFFQDIHLGISHGRSMWYQCRYHTYLQLQSMFYMEADIDNRLDLEGMFLQGSLFYMNQHINLSYPYNQCI